jgi:hypothetical protein
MQSGLSAKFEDAANLISKVWTSEFSMMLSAKFGRWCCESIPTTQAQENVRLFKIRSRIGEDLLLPVRRVPLMRRLMILWKEAAENVSLSAFKKLCEHIIRYCWRRRRDVQIVSSLDILKEYKYVAKWRRGSNKLFLLLIFYFPQSEIDRNSNTPNPIPNFFDKTTVNQ